ncbi:hypothetical protein M441DRAFT_453279 [Trichoderma asperellum CBS 433.97]|uniref:C2H2-type domain-containing protein n=1 Tax=Trichoderma asperellum (strain ATCC 204424 / CBS 433.97 / NBRC 101777) TaxID=1042311 RepID=A0A2T3ZG73_TRIA4|nr:hypothetical protein M441DRAFT_453279 [Trichoderma asperellum CBS 433.97]PTB43804.1 hypothetical protein M441DRAFT_453279 [Trichoderma asperellum CBS 433.97]
MEEANRQDGVVCHEEAQDAFSYNNDDATGFEQGNVLSLENDDDLEFEEDYDDVQKHKDVSAAVVKCIFLFGKQMGQANSPCASNKPETTNERSKEIAEFIVDMNSNSMYWFERTSALARDISDSLYSLFQEYRGVKTEVIGLLEVLIENLESVISGGTEYLYTPLEAMEGIRFAIEELHALTEMIRKASIRNEDLSLDAAFIKDDTTDFKNHMFPIIRRMFPHAQPSLCDQLALSVAIRRRRLRLTFKDAEKLRARRARSARSQSNNNQEYPASAIPSQPSQPQPQLLYTLARLPHNVEGGITCTESVVTRNKLNVEKVSTAFLSRHPKIWKDHLNEDVKPYVCLSEQCRTPVLFFRTIGHWVDHMNHRHSPEWTKRIHIGTWLCDFEHDVARFNELESFREHMNDEHNHPIRGPPTKHELDVLEICQYKLVTRDEHICPFCDCIPDIPKRDISTSASEENLHQPLHEHIASHLQNLAVLSIPGLDTAEASEIMSDNCKAEEKCSWLGEGEKDSCPRGYARELCDISLSDVRSSSDVGQEPRRRRKSEPEYLHYHMRDNIDEELRAYFGTLEIFTAHGIE